MDTAKRRPASPLSPSNPSIYKEVGRVGSWWQWGRGAAARVSFPARLVDIRHLHRREHPDDPAAHMVEELVAAATALAQAVVAYDGKGREKVL